MLLEPTIDKLHELRLANMADAWQQQQRDAKVGALSFDERFSLLVDAEHQARDNRRLTRLLKDAQLRIPQACVEDVESGPGRGLEKALLRQLGSCTWVTEHLNVLITGPTGVGKSYLGSALAHAAYRADFSVRSPKPTHSCSMTSGWRRWPMRRS
jgi:DNA replication protein DnaC